MCRFELGSDTGSDYRRRGGTVNSETTHVHQSQGGGVGGCDSPMEDLAEFIQGRGNVEAELNSLTLSDSDQRTLYESAKIIQSAFRQYKVQFIFVTFLSAQFEFVNNYFNKALVKWTSLSL